MISVLLLALAAQAKEPLDLHRCNNLAGHAGISIVPTGKERAFYHLDNGGNLHFDGGARTKLLSSAPADLTFYEYVEKSGRIGEGIGTGGVLKSKVKLFRKDGKPVSLQSNDTFYSLSGGEKDWKRIKAGTLNPKKNERTRETESWVQYGFSKNRCYVSQEGRTLDKKRYVTFDQLLCNRILQVTNREDVDVLHDYREGNTNEQSEARRVLRLVRDAQVARDESLKAEGQRLLAVDGPPEHQLPGTLPAEDSSALQELRACTAAQVRNGLYKPEARSKENTDFMGNEPQPDLGVEE